MSLDHYSYQNLLRDRLQIDILRNLRGEDKGIARDLQVLIKGTGVKGIKDLSGDALMSFAKDALAIIHPQEEARTPDNKPTWPPVSEGPIEPNGKGWISFDEACLTEEDRGPEYMGKVESAMLIKVLTFARGQLGEEATNAVLYEHTGEQAFSAQALKDGEGIVVAGKLLARIKATGEDDGQR